MRAWVCAALYGLLCLMSAFRLWNKYSEAGQLRGTRAAPVRKDREGDVPEPGWDLSLCVRTRIRPGEGHLWADGLAHPWTTVRVKVVVSQSPSSVT